MVELAATLFVIWFAANCVVGFVNWSGGWAKAGEWVFMILSAIFVILFFALRA